MPRRRTPFVTDEYYHVYNRGVDGRAIVRDHDDADRFMQSIREFNTLEPIGSIYQLNLERRKTNLIRSAPGTKLVDFVAYCLNPNHFHFLLRQVVDGGISEFLHRMAGYTRFFNEKYQRQGTLFQGTTKSIHVDSDRYLLRLSAYINLNPHVHGLQGKLLALGRSSLGEYMGMGGDICDTTLTLGQFRDGEVYGKFAREALEDTLARRRTDKAIEVLL